QAERFAKQRPPAREPLTLFGDAESRELAMRRARNACAMVPAVQRQVDGAAINGIAKIGGFLAAERHDRPLTCIVIAAFSDLGYYRECRTTARRAQGLHQRLFDGK